MQYGVYRRRRRLRTLRRVPFVVATAPGTLPAFISGEGGGGGADAAGTIVEANMYIGPFVDGNGNMYTFTEDDANTFNLAARKSTDNGVTWTNPANKNTVVDLESTWCVHDPANDLIHILNMRSSSNSLRYVPYRTSDHGTPDTFGSDVSIYSTATPAADQCVSLARRSDGDLIAFYRTDPSGTDQRIGFKVSTTGGSTWGSETILDSTSGKSHTQVMTVLGESDVTHVFYFNETDATIMHKTLSSADVLSSSQVVSDNAVKTMTAGESNPMANRPVYWDEGGDEHVFVAWIRSSNDFLVGAELINGTASAEETVSDVAVYHTPTNLGSFQVSAALANQNSTVFAVYSDASTHDLFVATRTSGTWGTDVESTDAVNAMSVSANVITHGGGTRLGYVYSIDTGVDSADQVYYDEYELATVVTASPGAATANGSVLAPGKLAVVAPTPSLALGAVTAPVQAVARAASPAIGNGATVAPTLLVVALPSASLALAATNAVTPFVGQTAAPSPAIGLGVTPAPTLLVIRAVTSSGALAATISPSLLATAGGGPATALGIAPNPSVDVGGNITASPSPAIGLGVTPTPTLLVTKDAAAALAQGASIPAVGAVLATVGAALAAGATLQPVLLATRGASPALALALAPNPTVSVGGNITASPAPAIGIGSAPTPVPLVTRAVVAAIAAASVPAAGRGVTSGPGAATGAGIAQQPALVALRAALAVLAAAGAPNPETFEGEIYVAATGDLSDYPVMSGEFSDYPVMSGDLSDGPA